MGEYKEIAAKLTEADAILIGASNGFSISEGLHIFADNQAFEEVFGDFKRLRLSDLHGHGNLLRSQNCAEEEKS